MNISQDNDDLDLLSSHHRPSEMFLTSYDSYRETIITDQTMSDGWNDRPPLFMEDHNESIGLLKGMIRKGIPPVLRCAVWLSNIVQAAHPSQSLETAREYRTLAKVRPLEHAYRSLLDSVGIVHDESTTISVPLFGADVLPEMNITTTADPRIRVLCALEHITGMEYCPLIVSLTTLFLHYMSEAYAFCAIREMCHYPSWFFATSRSEDVAWGRAFWDVLEKLHPSTARGLKKGNHQHEDDEDDDSNHNHGIQQQQHEEEDDDDEHYLKSGDSSDDDMPSVAPMFDDFFMSILPLEYSMRILDIYTLEGYKVLFRFGVAILVMYYKDRKKKKKTSLNWNDVKEWAHSNIPSFEFLAKKAYGVHGRSVRQRLRFPRRQILSKLIKMEQQEIVTLQNAPKQQKQQQREVTRPVGLVRKTLTNENNHHQTPPSSLNTVVTPVLAESTSTRLLLAQWLPMTLRLTNLDLIYSTSFHGRTLDMFYRQVRRTRHSLLLCEVLEETGTDPHVIGMYASQTWRVSTQVYGDGECFLFRIKPNPSCWKWTPPEQYHMPPESTTTNDDRSIGSHLSDNETALLEQFMVGTRQFISMGGNPDGSSGLRFNEDFTKGESSRAAGFDNEPLVTNHNHDELSLSSTTRHCVFDVGLVEVYQFVREMDGGSVS